MSINNNHLNNDLSINQLIKNVYKDKNDTMEKVSERLYEKIINLNKYKIDLDKESFINHLSNLDFVFSTPILKNNNSNQEHDLYSSCYLFNLDDDDDLYKFLYEKLPLTKSGGFGLNLSSLNQPDSVIDIFRDISLFENNKGTYARTLVYNVSIELFNHKLYSVFDKFDIRRGNKIDKIFLSICFNNEFFRRIINNEDWYLIKYDKDLYMKLKDSCNYNFNELYNNVPIENRINVRPARDYYKDIISLLINNFFIYCWNKDNSNKRSQFNDDYIINTQNLCLEINQPRTKFHDTTYCCLGSINLSKFNKDNEIDFERIGCAVSTLVRSLTIITNSNDLFYKNENYNTHDISIGILGYYDLIRSLNVDYKDSRKHMWFILQTIYYYAIKESNKIYESIKDNDKCYFTLNKFSYELYEPVETNNPNFQLKNPLKEFGLMYDFESLRGLKIFNRRLTALMPTSTVADICNVQQSFHAPRSHKYIRETNYGSSYNLNIPKNITCMSDLTLDEQLQYAFDRQFWLDNTQSLELFHNPELEKEIGKSLQHYLIKANYYAKLPTSIYYIRDAKEKVINTKINCASCSM